MSVPMNTSNNNESNQVQEEMKEGIVVARGTPNNHSVNSSALRGSGENQLLARSEDDGASPMLNSSSNVDDNASSSVGSNDTYRSAKAFS